MTEVSTTVNVPSAAQLRDLQSFEDAQKLIEGELGGAVVQAADVLGDGFELFTEKDKLIGLPLIFVTWQFSPGKYGEDFCTARVMAQFGKNDVRKYIINDGSTGICAQLREMTDKNAGAKMLFAPKGLRKSEYEYTESDGSRKPATTHYIDTSPKQ